MSFERAASIVLLLIAFAQLSAEPVRPNIVFIYCDNLGYGDIEPFGSILHRTPNLNRMAREGRKFTHFYVTAGVCTPSRASLMTGCYSQRIGLHTNPRDGQVLRPISPYGLHPDEVTVAEVLQQRGYRTAIIGKWHLGDQTPFLPTRQGFDEFFGVPYSDDMTRAVGQRIGKRMDGNRWPLLPLMDGEKVIEAPVDRNGLTKRYTDEALSFIRENQDRPFFLYMPQAMPGSTSQPFASPEFRGKSKNGPWGDSIEELDWSMGVILDELDKLGLSKKTLVIWTSDNGAPLARDMTSPTRGSNQPLKGRGYTTAEGAFRVPTLMWWPATIPPQTVCHEMASTLDMLPTFAALAGARSPVGRRLDGHDIRQLMIRQPPPPTPYKAFYYYERDQLQAVRSGPWKLFVPLKTWGKHPHFRKGQTAGPLLFNVVADIRCTTNVADQYPVVVRRMLRLAERAREDLGDRGQTGKNQRAAGFVANPKPQVK